MVRATVFVRHDACVWRVFVDEHMVRPAVRAARKDVGFPVRDGDRQDAPGDRFFQPVGQRSGIEQRIFNKVRGPGLQSAMRKLSPSRFGCGLNLRSGVVRC